MKPPRWLYVLLGLAGFALLVIQSRTIWLPWIAQNLIVEDRLRPADSIVVFGAEEERARHAAKLYQEGLAARILVTGGLTLKGAKVFCHQQMTGADLSAKVLIDAGVPKNAVIVIPEGTSTYEEGEVVNAFMKMHGYRSVIAVSSPYHMRRVRATLSRLVQGTRVAIQYSPAQGTGSSASDWWRREDDVINVTNEYLKLAYYHLSRF